ncbi:MULTISPECIES: ISAs1 family transposase [Alphaproteobacteria]|jgi:predicted transposase YbfD/YdcC|uniref:ISAs1 family transposase n=6 Tax=Alphaproteobacteria TaxID=28211 RepID=A0ABY4SMA6_9CAUL|nr:MULTISPECIES: ISAs1 family transposase [Alphaproteobacteria]URI15403.1 ISAs1 family transposase [Brevundimonas albigilva]
MSSMDEAILLWLDGIAARSEAFNAFITVISDNPLIKGVPILSAFEDVPDPRAENTRHDLGELLVIAFVSVLCGATSCAEMAAFGRAKESVFRGFLKLKHAVPSHDTFSAVFRMIDPKALDAAFGRVLADVAALLRDGDVIAVDGKALRGARDAGESGRTRMMVSAYAARLRLTLASVPADRGTELEAAIEALGLIALKGKVVTADALHCNRRTVAAINAGGGDWCLALKANQDSLLSDARASFGAEPDAHPSALSEDIGHGRTETRKATVVSSKALAEHHEFPGLKAFGRVEATRKTAEGTTSETRYFALSWVPTPEVLLATVRAHWAIENSLHWQLDVSFREDAARNRKDNSPGNIAILRRRALDVMRRDTSKGSLSIKLKRAGWDDDFLRNVLNGLLA